MVVADPSMTTDRAPELARFLSTRLHIDYFDTLKALTRPDSRFAYVARRVPASLAVSVVDEATRRSGSTGWPRATTRSGAIPTTTSPPTWSASSAPTARWPGWS